MTWLIYGLVFRLLIDKKPFNEALFSRDSIVFFVICAVVEVIAYYVRQVKKAGKQKGGTNCESHDRMEVLT